jgi:hypothetical protein
MEMFRVTTESALFCIAVCGFFASWFVCTRAWDKGGIYRYAPIFYGICAGIGAAISCYIGGYRSLSDPIGFFISCSVQGVICWVHAWNKVRELRKLKNVFSPTKVHKLDSDDGQPVRASDTTLQKAKRMKE